MLSNYEQRNLWELLSSSKRRPSLSQDLELLPPWHTGSLEMTQEPPCVLWTWWLVPGHLNSRSPCLA